MDDDRATIETSSSHASVSGSPGEGARAAGLARVFWPILLLVLVIGIILGMAVPYRIASPMVAAAIAAILLVGLGLLLFWSGRRLRAFFKGAEGEEKVARILGFLPNSYHVYHSLWLSNKQSAGAGDVDHLVVGPTGIFVLETKNWSGEIAVANDEVKLNGRLPNRPPLQQVYNAARQVRDHIHEQAGMELKVHPVLCFASAGLIKGDSAASGVQICRDSDLSQLIQQTAETMLSDDKIERVVDVLSPRDPR